MSTSRGVSRIVWLSVCVALAGLMGSPTSARAGGMSILVPAYFAPGSGGPGGSGDGWAAMKDAASQVSITAIFNPNSGPAGSYDSSYGAAMSALESAGGHVVAYVNTFNFTTDTLIPLATVEGQISTYISQYGISSPYGNLLNGFFLDGMNVLPGANLTYYQSLYSYIKGLSSSYTVIGNPGQPFLNGVTPAQYFTTADTLNIFEGPNFSSNPSAAAYNNYPYGLNSPPPAWFQSGPSSQYSNVVYDVPTVAAMTADVSKAASLNTGYVYITDQTGPFGPAYDQLPSYWDQEVAAVASIPEPGVLTNLVSAAACGALAVTLRWCRRQRRV